MDHRDEFDNWCNLWDKAQQDGVFPVEEEKPEAELPAFLREPEVESDPYYDYLDSDMEGLIQESTQKSSKSKKSANPIYPDSVGKDQEPSNPWLRNNLFERVSELKQRLYDIECKFNTESAGGKKWVEKAEFNNFRENKKLLTQIDSLRKQIDDLSDTLGIQDEPPQSMRKIQD
jgi:hypothetical protein